MRFALFTLLIALPLFALLLYLVVLIIRALRKYVKGAPVREEARAVRASLSEKLRENRMRCKMTQEFVAEAVGVSRQAVSKWESCMVSQPSSFWESCNTQKE